MLYEIGSRKSLITDVLINICLLEVKTRFFAKGMEEV